MAFIIILVIAIGFFSVVVSLTTSIGKIILWIALPIVAALLVGVLVSNAAGVQAGRIAALCALIGFAIVATKICS